MNWMATNVFQIWISPIVENLSGSSADGESYHGYWAQNINEVNSNFGSESDLVALSAALHAKGMYLMVDVVTNHMGYLGCGTCVDYSVFTPFNSVWTSFLRGKAYTNYWWGILLSPILSHWL
jgi:maltooligosyltrehalose synthase